MPRLAPQGYACIAEPGKALREADTFTCCHCNRLIHVPPNKRFEMKGDFCRSCMKIICAKCADARVCSPFLKQIEQAEERDYRLNQMLRCS